MSAQEVAQQTHFLQLAETLTQAWSDLASKTDPAEAQATPAVGAFLLLNRWADNPLAAAIENTFPDVARDRCAVPDDYFLHREERAPCLLALPEALSPAVPPDGLAAQEARSAMAQWLAFAWEQVEQRLARQDLGAVLFSRQNIRSVAAHLARLGYQQPPGGGAARLFRYQDARVMQRTWPLLAAAQQRQWLGPVEAWWALEQPWGPWDEAALPAAVPAAAWFRAVPPEAEARAAPASLNALLDAWQWHAAHASPEANAIWAGYAEQQVPVPCQPDGATLLRLLGDAHRLGLRDTNAQDYVYATWRHDAPEGQPRELSWQAPRARAALQRILQTLRQRPEARFATLYLDAVNQERRAG